MNRITISMPEKMNEWVESQIETGRFGNTSEYFRDLVRHDQEKREMAMNELRDILEKAQASGVSDRTIPEIMEDARQQAIAKGLMSE